jgi:hypothetical protein
VRRQQLRDDVSRDVGEREAGEERRAAQRERLDGCRLYGVNPSPRRTCTAATDTECGSRGPRADPLSEQHKHSGSPYQMQDGSGSMICLDNWDICPIRGVSGSATLSAEAVAESSSRRRLARRNE